MSVRVNRPVAILTYYKRFSSRFEHYLFPEFFAVKTFETWHQMHFAWFFRLLSTEFAYSVLKSCSDCRVSRIRSIFVNCDSIYTVVKFAVLQSNQTLFLDCSIVCNIWHRPYFALFVLPGYLACRGIVFACLFIASSVIIILPSAFL